jgi:RES domain
LQTGPSPTGSFKLLYIAQDLDTGIAETIIRDRFQGRARRVITEDEAKTWGVTEISARSPLILIDLRTTGPHRLGVSTNAVRSKAQLQGRMLSQAIYESTDADGIIYMSRLTNTTCIAVYDRAVATKLTATPIVEIVTLAEFVAALQRLNVQLIRS